MNKKPLNDFIAPFNHGKGPVNLMHLGYNAREYRPVEIHLKDDGSTEDKPAFYIVLAKVGHPCVYGGVTLKMLNTALNELGYEIQKIDK